MSLVCFAAAFIKLSIPVTHTRGINQTIQPKENIETRYTLFLLLKNYSKMEQLVGQVREPDSASNPVIKNLIRCSYVFLDTQEIK